MFRMKSNALMLTVITTVSALAIGLLSLSYISYYSAEKSAQSTVGGDFSFNATEEAEKFKGALVDAGIDFKERNIEVLQVEVNIEEIIDIKVEEDIVNFANKQICYFLS